MLLNSPRLCGHWRGLNDSALHSLSGPHQILWPPGLMQVRVISRDKFIALARPLTPRRESWDGLLRQEVQRSVGQKVGAPIVITTVARWGASEFHQCFSSVSLNSAALVGSALVRRPGVIRCSIYKQMTETERLAALCVFHLCDSHLVSLASTRV